MIIVPRTDGDYLDVFNNRCPALPRGFCLHPFADASHGGVETYLQPLQELHAAVSRRI